METPKKGIQPPMGFAGTPSRGAVAADAQPPPVNGKYKQKQPNENDDDLYKTKILGLHLEQDEKDAILNKYNQALRANSLLDEYKTSAGYKEFVQLYAEIIHRLRPKSHIKFALKPEFHASINAQIRAQEEAKRSTGGRRRNYKRTNRRRVATANRKARRQARTRKN